MQVSNNLICYVVVQTVVIIYVFNNNCSIVLISLTCLFYLSFIVYNIILFLLNQNKNLCNKNHTNQLRLKRLYDIISFCLVLNDLFANRQVYLKISAVVLFIATTSSKPDLSLSIEMSNGRSIANFLRDCFRLIVELMLHS